MLAAFAHEIADVAAQLITAGVELISLLNSEAAFAVEVAEARELLDVEIAGLEFIEDEVEVLSNVMDIQHADDTTHQPVECQLMVLLRRTYPRPSGTGRAGTSPAPTVFPAMEHFAMT